MSEMGQYAEDPLIGKDEEDDSELASPKAAFNNTWKSIVGSGVIGLPWAVSSCGYVVGTAGLVVIALLSAYTMQHMVFGQRCVREHRARNGESASATITMRDIGFLAMDKYGMYATDVIMILCQIGANIAFMAFIVSGFTEAIVPPDTSNAVTYDDICNGGGDEAKTTQLAIYVPIILICCVTCALKSTASLEATSTLGNFIFLFSLAVMLVDGSTNHAPTFSGRTEGLSGWLPRFGSFGSFTTAAPALGAMACSGAGNTVDPVAALDCAPVAATTIAGFNQFFGTAIFAFSAHCEILGVEQFVRDKKGYPKILTASVLMSCVIYIFFGCIGYAFYHDAVCSSVFKNLTAGPLARVVKGSMAFMVLCNYPLTAFGALVNIEAMLGMAEDEPGGSIFVGFKKLVLRSLIVLSTALIAYLVPDFGFLLAFVGCYFNLFLAFCLPPMFHIYLSTTASPLNKALNWGLVAFAVVYAHYSAYTLVKNQFF